MAKDISKSIRLSQEDFEFIDSFEGESFSEKLDNMIILMRSAIPEKLQEVRRLEDMINVKRAEFRSISAHVRDLDELLRRTEYIVSDLRSIDAMINNKFDGVIKRCEKSDV